MSSRATAAPPGVAAICRMNMPIQAAPAMHEADTTILRAHVVTCTQEAFAAYAIHVALDEGDPRPSANDAQIVAFIGFGGARLRGALTLMAPQALWQKTYPIAVAGGERPGESDLLDWCGEVVNQVLGRIKNQLGRRGVELQVSTPKALHATQLTISHSAQRSVCMLRSSMEPDTTIGVWFDAGVEGSGPLFATASDPPLAPPVEDLMSEGDLLLF
jgi:CheY-specific phosphatase CheX